MARIPCSRVVDAVVGGFLGIGLVLVALHAASPAPLAPLAAADAAGGWRPTSANACALAVGIMVGGALGMPLNPMGGAIAISVGLHLGLFACS